MGRCGPSNVHPHLIHPSEWPLHVPSLAPSLTRMASGSGGRYAPSDIDAEIASGRFQAWIVPDCLLVTEIKQYPRLRVLQLIGIDGTRPRRWLYLLAAIEAQARAWGCSRLEALHPAGYARYLGRTGWTEFHILSEKRL